MRNTVSLWRPNLTFSRSVFLGGRSLRCRDLCSSPRCRSLWCLGSAARHWSGISVSAGQVAAVGADSGDSRGGQRPGPKRSAYKGELEEEGAGHLITRCPTVQLAWQDPEARRPASEAPLAGPAGGPRRIPCWRDSRVLQIRCSTQGLGLLVGGEEGYSKYSIP